MPNDTDFKFKYLQEQYETLTSLGNPDGSGVFLCRDSRSGDIVVKKYVAPTARAVHEKLNSISSMHLAAIYDMAFSPQTGIVIEEFVSGITLRKYLQRYGPPSQRQLCRIICDICDALYEPHRLGIIHRDIKPDNIMISNDGVLKVIDFGIARIMKESHPQDTSFLGTPNYASPEQFGFSQTDCRSDIYSIGILMSELLLGEVLPVDLLRQQRFKLGPLAPVILRCIEMDPKQRFHNVSELRRAILKIDSPLGTQVLPENHSLSLEKTVSDDSDRTIISWLPGFRTGKTWKNYTAIAGYVFLAIGTLSMITAENYLCSAPVFLLELLAIILYLWADTLIALNIGNWDEKIFPFSRFPHALMDVIRVFLWFAIFYMGISLEEYVHYTLMGLPRTG